MATKIYNYTSCNKKKKIQSNKIMRPVASAFAFSTIILIFAIPRSLPSTRQLEICTRSPHARYSPSLCGCFARCWLSTRDLFIHYFIVVIIIINNNIIITSSVIFPHSPPWLITYYGFTIGFVCHYLYCPFNFIGGQKYSRYYT